MIFLNRGCSWVFRESFFPLRSRGSGGIPQPPGANTLFVCLFVCSFVGIQHENLNFVCLFDTKTPVDVSGKIFEAVLRTPPHLTCPCDLRVWVSFVFLKVFLLLLQLRLTINKHSHIKKRNSLARGYMQSDQHCDLFYHVGDLIGSTIN